MKCPRCHHENPEETNYCGKCAAPLPSSRDAGSFRTETVQHAVHELSTGQTFAGRYQVIEELGKGGMGRVYKVFDTKIREKVALKLIRPEIAADRETIERFSNELRLARRIGHRNVCRMFDIGEAEGSHFITMEFVHGEDLKNMIRMSTGLTAGTVLSIGKQICDGLTEAHGLGIVHRDLKPQNIMIDKAGNAKIMDFGIARSIREKGVTGPSVMIGTPEYMSPEQAEAKDVDQRSDVYSLGIILYEMATGRVPFEGDTALSVAMKHKGEAPKSPRQLNPGLPADLDRAVLKCLEKDRARRWQTAADLRAELDRIETGIPTTERVAPERKTLTSREITVKFTLRKLFVPALALLAVGAAAATVLLLIPGKRQALSTGGKPVVAVMYFKNSTGNKAFENWRDGLPTAIITGLSQSRYVGVLSAADMYGILKKLGLLEAVNYTPEDLKKAALAGKANCVLAGSLSKAGEVFRIDYSLQDLARDKLLGAGSVTGSGEDSILGSLVDDLIRKIKVDLNLSSAKIEADIENNVGNIITKSPEAFKNYLDGRRLFLNAQYRESIALMEKALALDPEFAMALRSIGMAYGNLGFEDKRREYLGKALNNTGRLSDYDKYLIQGQYDQYSGKVESAIEAFKKGLELYPGDDTLSVALGNQYNALEEFSKAVEVLDAAVKNGSSGPFVYTNLSTSYGGLGDFARGAAIDKEYLDKFGDLASVRLDLASAYFGEGKWDLALAEIERAITLNPNNKSCLLPKAQIHLLQDDFVTAEKEFQALLDAPEEEIRGGARMQLAYLLQTRGRFRELIKTAQQLIVSTQQAGEKAVEIYGRDYLSYVFSVRKDYRSALDQNDLVLKYAEERHDDDWKKNGLFMRVIILSEMKSFTEAARTAADYKKLLEAGLNKKQIRYYYAAMSKVELEKGDFADSIRHAEDALALEPYIDRTKPAFLFECLGQAHFRRGDWDKARTAYEMIPRLTNGRVVYGDIYAKSYYWLGQILERQGDSAKAREYYSKFLDLWKDADPEFSEVADARSRLAALKAR